MSEIQDQLALSIGLTAKTNQLCIGLEYGVADIYELVTPTTAELLKWWFGEDMIAARSTLNFHAGQRQAILNAIVAHEVMGVTALLDLYQQAAPDALLAGSRMSEVAQSKHAHPKYCLKMATGTGKTWVLQALLIWQLLNKTAALAEGIDDPRFTRQFLIVAPGLIVYDRLLDAFCGKQLGGVRDFATSDVAQFAGLFIPEAHRELVFGFVRGNVCSKSEIGLKATGNGMIAIANWHLLADAEELESEEEIAAPGAMPEAQQVIAAVLPLTPGRATGNSLDMLDRRYARGNVLEFLVGLPDLMVFNDEAHHIHELKKEGETSEVEWQKSLSRIAESKGRRFVQVDFSATPYNDVGSGKNKRKLYFPHIITDFDLKSAMRAGLVKSLVLDRRKEIGALPLEFKAERDEGGNPCLSEGQRVMLRDEEYADLKRENRERINTGLEPGNLIDILSIVEHPAFQSFYDELMAEGLAGVTTDEMDSTSSTGDVIAVELRDGFEQYDFAIPFILREAESFLEHHALDLTALPIFSDMSLAQLTALLGKGDTFVSQDLQSSTLFGDYRVEGAVMNVSGYNDFLARLTRRISQALSQPLPKGNKIATHLANPYLQTNTAELTGWMDGYIRGYLFGAAFDPMPSNQTQEENWRVLLLQPVLDHISKVFAVALIEAEHQDVVGETEVRYRNLSEVPKLMMRESNSLPVAKCIYERLPIPARNGGLERAFIEWAQDAFCKISETRHDFVRLRYVKEDGLPAFYSPDFLVRTEQAVYLVETKAQQQTTHPNVQRKLKAATAWCGRINGLAAELRGSMPWHYVLLGETAFHEWRSKGARLGDLLNYARVRPLTDASTQERLEF